MNLQPKQRKRSGRSSPLRLLALPLPARDLLLLHEANRQVSPTSNQASPAPKMSRTLSPPELDTSLLPTSLSFGSSKKAKRKEPGFQKNAILFMLSLLGIFFLFDWWVLARLRGAQINEENGSQFSVSLQGEWSSFPKGDRPPGVMYGRLLGLAAHALAEGELSNEPLDLWQEPYADASAWRPCANESGSNITVSSDNTRYILISANGGLNQQRVAICNGVAVAHLLNATLVLPQFLFSSVWQDTSQFGDIYQENFFIDILKYDIKIVKELPNELQSLDLDAIGSIVSDMDVPKEAKPSFFINYILPILLRNRVVHFFGFGNRLSFDPIPFDLQRLRCKCNFYALKFIPKIQRAAGLLVRRMREQDKRWGPEMTQGEGSSTLAVAQSKGLHMLVDAESLNLQATGEKYIGLHLRFETDMVAYSMCEFGGGDAEREELEAYREVHFPTLTDYKKNGKLLSASQLREEGKCPLTPEEAVLMLVALGFKRGTRIFLAGAHIYGGQSRMVALSSLYPNLVTKEDLLSPKELEPFTNKSSQLAALDFIGCAAADIFAMTDSGSQLASLVSGYRIYFGGGLLPTIRPNKRRLAGIFSHNMTIEWEDFGERVRKTVKESKRIQMYKK
ncbi:hypothetical protein GOP47_0027334 [Adiantum capillus-veneris]|nr:hypothetical protein GOP47_0027334 [Adiantum capillus-veneris]